jgi:hypothetical protein
VVLDDEDLADGGHRAVPFFIVNAMADVLNGSLTPGRGGLQQQSVKVSWRQCDGCVNAGVPWD